MICITTLVENSLGEHKGLINEHGLSFHIDTGCNILLFDVGQSDAIVRNAAKLRIDLKAARQVVLSHGHYDHSGGLRALAAHASGFTLLTGSGFFDDKFGDLGPAREFLGNDFDVRWLAEAGIAQETLVEPIREVVPGVWALTGFPRRYADERINPRFKVRRGGALVEDDFADEVMLAVDSPRGPIAVLGCSHPGVKNMLDAAAERLGRPIHAVIGGTHLVEATTDSLELTLQYLRQKDIVVIGASHCTGAAAGERLAAFGERYYRNGTGTALVVE